MILKVSLQDKGSIGGGGRNAKKDFPAGELMLALHWENVEKFALGHMNLTLVFPVLRKTMALSSQINRLTL